MQLYIWHIYNIYTLQKQAPFLQIYQLKIYNKKFVLVVNSWQVLWDAEARCL